MIKNDDEERCWLKQFGVIYLFIFSISAKHEKIKDEDGMEIKTENDEFKLPRKERTYTCEQCEQTFPR